MTEFIGPELLRSNHAIDEFNCGIPALDSWLTKKATHNQAEGASRTWVVANGERVVGFYASCASVVFQSEAIKRAVRNQPDPLPALLLGRLAVDVKFQGQGLAAGLLKHFLLKSKEVAQITGVRLLLVHAKSDEAASFYRRYGFESSPIDELTLMLRVKDITDLV